MLCKPEAYIASLMCGLLMYYPDWWHGQAELLLSYDSQQIQEVILNISMTETSYLLVQFTIVGSQAAIFYWKKIHKRSYELVISFFPPWNTLCWYLILRMTLLPCWSLKNTKFRLVCAFLQVTLLGLWLVPAVASFYFHFWLFLAVCFLFSKLWTLCRNGLLNATLIKISAHLI